jgi:DNA polymerase III delta prime subunit
MDIKTFKSLATKLPPQIAVLMRGPTGVGKSHLALACAKDLGLPFIDVRGSTMDESKVTGIPDFEVSKEMGVATFVLPSWFVRGCREPVVMMLDELNRSMPQVQQAFFQVVLDRSLGNDANGNPMTLHPDTRIFAAVNQGAEYDVNDMDPALLRRFWTVDLEPTTEDWISWAKEDDRVDPVTVDFIRQNSAHLRADMSSIEPGTLAPNPASWHRLDESLCHMGMAPSKIAGTRPEGLYALSQGFVGTEAAIAFTEFVAKYSRQISAEDVLQGRVKKKTVKSLKSSESLAVLDKIVDHATTNDWTDKEADNVVDFARLLPDEQMVHLWNAVMSTKNMVPIKALHSRIGAEIVEQIRKARALAGE